MTAVFTIIAKGGVVMIPLLLCSFVSLAVIIERWLFWRRERLGGDIEPILALVEKGDFHAALDRARDGGTAVVRVIAAGIAHRNPSPTEAMEAKALEEIARMKRYLPALDTIITLAPLLGLLGTVTGMIQSFQIMGTAGISQPHAITGGIAEALIATATGLFVAIFTLVPYNYFMTRVERETERIERFGTKLEMLLKQGQG